MHNFSRKFSLTFYSQFKGSNNLLNIYPGNKFCFLHIYNILVSSSSVNYLSHLRTGTMLHNTCQYFEKIRRVKIKCMIRFMGQSVADATFKIFANFYNTWHVSVPYFDLKVMPF